MKNPNRIPGSSLASRMSKYIGKPFQEGATGPDAYDCIGLIGRYILDSGKDIPRTFGDLNEFNYWSMARGDKKREKALLREWVLTLGTEIPVNNKIAGDLLIINNSVQGNNYVFPAIYIGKNQAFTVINSRGVTPFFIMSSMTIELVVRI